MCTSNTKFEDDLTDLQGQGIIHKLVKRYYYDNMTKVEFPSEEIDMEDELD